MIADLGRFRDPRTRERLLTIIQQERGNAHDWALEGLAKYHPQDAQSIYVQMLQQSRSERAQALQGLARLQDRAAIESHLNHADPEDRQRAIAALGHIGDPASLPALRALRQDPNDTVRRLAEEIIAKIEYLRPLPK